MCMLLVWLSLRVRGQGNAVPSCMRQPTGPLREYSCVLVVHEKLNDLTSVALVLLTASRLRSAVDYCRPSRGCGKRPSPSIRGYDPARGLTLSQTHRKFQRLFSVCNSEGSRGQWLPSTPGRRQTFARGLFLRSVRPCALVDSFSTGPDACLRVCVHAR